MRSMKARTALAGLCLLATVVAGPAAAQVHVTGTIAAFRNGVQDGEGRFECTSDNPCTGTYSVSIRDNGCSNSFTLADRFTVTGVLAPSPPGPVSVVLTLDRGDYDNSHNPDGSCSIVPGSIGPHVSTLTGTFDGRHGVVSASHTEPDGHVETERYEYTVDQPPPFPMTVRATVDAVSATATADMNFAPADVGKSGSVYVFAFAPPAAVKRAPDGTKADPALPCVLAQLNSAGQLVAVSAQSMQAYITGVLTAGGQAVSILNGVPTVQIAGATFIVGYGATAASMIAAGTTRPAVTVPASTTTCKAEAPQTGWWWNPAQGGRGFSIEARGTNLFMAAYLYDATGQSSWLYASGASALAGAVFQGDLLAIAGGQTLTGSYQAAHGTPSPGPIALTFQDASHGVLSWPGGNLAIERFPIVANGLTTTPLANQPESGWWWNEAEGGRGFFIEWQGTAAFLATYMYTAAGTPIWYSSQATTPNMALFSDRLLQYSNGQTLTGSYHLPTLPPADVGPVSITFSAFDTATITLPGGRQVPLKRFRF
jgi:hypothetical protein